MGFENFCEKICGYVSIIDGDIEFPLYLPNRELWVTLMVSSNRVCLKYGSNLYPEKGYDYDEFMDWWYLYSDTSMEIEWEKNFMELLPYKYSWLNDMNTQTLDEIVGDLKSSEHPNLALCCLVNKFYNREVFNLEYLYNHQYDDIGE